MFYLLFFMPILVGYSGADVANLCREAALGPIRSIHSSSIQHVSAEEVRLGILYIRCCFFLHNFCVQCRTNQMSMLCTEITSFDLFFSVAYMDNVSNFAAPKGGRGHPQHASFSPSPLPLHSVSTSCQVYCVPLSNQSIITCDPFAVVVQYKNW